MFKIVDKLFSNADGLKEKMMASIKSAIDESRSGSLAFWESKNKKVAALDKKRIKQICSEIGIAAIFPSHEDNKENYFLVVFRKKRRPKG